MSVGRNVYIVTSSPGAGYTINGVFSNWPKVVEFCTAEYGRKLQPVRDAYDNIVPGQWELDTGTGFKVVVKRETVR